VYIKNKKIPLVAYDSLEGDISFLVMTNYLPRVGSGTGSRYANTKEIFI
jgi:hypothetical protein